MNQMNRRKPGGIKMKPYQLLKKLINCKLKPITSNQNQEASKMKSRAIFKTPLTLNLSARGARLPACQSLADRPIFSGQGSAYGRKPLALFNGRSNKMKPKKNPLNFNLSARDGSAYGRKPLTFFNERNKAMKTKILFAAVLFAVIFFHS